MLSHALVSKTLAHIYINSCQEVDVFIHLHPCHQRPYHLGHGDTLNAFSKQIKDKTEVPELEVIALVYNTERNE